MSNQIVLGPGDGRQKMIVVGGHSGVGQDFVQSLRADTRFRDVDLFVPTQTTLDVLNDEDFEQVLREEGPFDYIVYTAGVAHIDWVKDLNTPKLRKTFGVNAFGFALLCGAHSDLFPEHEVRALAVVSDSSRTPMRGSLAYCSSKAALVSIIKCLARELAPRWSVNGVSPGIIEDTPMTDFIDSTVPEFRNWDPERAKQYEQSMIPMGRRATKQEVSHLMRDTLMGPKYMSGNITELTGGK